MADALRVFMYGPRQLTAVGWEQCRLVCSSLHPSFSPLCRTIPSVSPRFKSLSHFHSEPHLPSQTVVSQSFSAQSPCSMYVAAFELFPFSTPLEHMCIHMHVKRTRPWAFVCIALGYLLASSKAGPTVAHYNNKYTLLYYMQCVCVCVCACVRACVCCVPSSVDVIKASR